MCINERNKTKQLGVYHRYVSLVTLSKTYEFPMVSEPADSFLICLKNRQLLNYDERKTKMIISFYVPLHIHMHLCVCTHRYMHTYVLMEGTQAILSSALVHVIATAVIWFSAQMYRNFLQLHCRQTVKK